MILFCLLFFYTASVNASYVNALKHFNRMIDRKIDGIDGDMINSTKVIQFYINNIKAHVINKKAKEEDITPYHPILVILGTYTERIKHEEALPVRQFHYNNDDEKVDFFLEQICDICIPSGWLLRETFSFNMLWYVGKHKLSSIRVEKLESENKKQKEENEKLIKDNTFLKGQLEEREKACQETEKKISDIKLSSETTINNEKNECANLLEKWKLDYENQYNELAKLCEKKQTEGEITPLLKKTGNSSVHFENLTKKILELKLSLIMNKPLENKSNRFFWVCLGMAMCLLLQKGYSYCL